MVIPLLVLVSQNSPVYTKRTNPMESKGEFCDFLSLDPPNIKLPPPLAAFPGLLGMASAVLIITNTTSNECKSVKS